MYDSPLYLVRHEINDRDIFREAGKELGQAIDDMVLRKVVQMDIDIDKDKLVKALKQDMQRYEEAWDKGYEVGFSHGKTQNWTSIGDKLPETDLGGCIVYDGHEVQLANHFIDKDGVHIWFTPDCYESEEIRHVTHWMPLPEPPKEETKQTE
jgi:hypothetical protein